MMNKFSILSLIFPLFSLLHSQETWVQTYQPFGDEYDYFVEDIRVCPDQGYAVIGSIWNSEFSTNDGFMMKTDNDGNLLWANIDTVSFISGPEPSGFVVLDDGSLITVGNNFWFGGHYLLKRNPYGEIEWTLELESDYTIQAIELTNDENMIITGSSMDNTIFLQKFDLNGNLLWRETYLPDGFTYGGGYSVTQTIDDGYALTGVVNGPNNWDILVIKTDENGDSLWTWIYDGYGLTDKGNCITNTYEGDLLIGGYLNYNPPIYQYGFLGKFNLSGNNLFIHQFETWHIRSCLQDNDNNYVIYSGHAMLKTNDFGDTMWCTGFPYFSSYGDRCFQKIEDGFICLSSPSADYIELTKTDSIGNVTSIEENEILHNTINNFICYPNPFNPETKIAFSIPVDSKVNLTIYNIKGQKVKILVNDQLEKGFHEIIWNSKNNNNKQVASGVYLYKFDVDGKTKGVKKMLLLK